MLYKTFIDYFEKIESTSKRLNKTYILSKLLKTTKDDDLEQVTLLVQGKVFPECDQREIGVASKMIIKAISNATGYSSNEIEEYWRKLGDLGKVAEILTKKKKQSKLFSKELTVRKVFENLQKLAKIEGQNSTDIKIRIISELLSNASPREALYIVRTVLSELRVGIGEGTLRDAIVWAFFPKVVGIFVQCSKCGAWVPNSDECPECGAKLNPVAEPKISGKILNVKSLNDVKNKEIINYDFIICDDEKDAREVYNYIVDTVQNAYNILTDFALVSVEAKKGILNLKRVSLKPGRPVKVMLAIKVKTLREGFETVGRPAQLEYKYDGFRVHIHKWNGNVKVFTRRLEDVTHQFPDIVKATKYVAADSFIIDGEAVGYDKRTKKSLPFQMISQRIKRKYDIDRMVKELPVEVNVFDILYYNGENVLSKSLEERRKIIERIIKEKEGSIVLSKKLVTSSEEDARKFFEESISHSNEGIMFKNLKAPYKPGARVGFMVKYKQVMETLDLVIVGAEWGEGKRAKWLSSFYIACRDNDGNLLRIGKAASGLKEKPEEGLSFEDMTKMLSPLIIEQKGRYVKVEPKVIVEVAYEEIQKSPEYESGFALRFPRIIRLRDDKPIDEISELSHIKELYENQRNRNKDK